MRAFLPRGDIYQLAMPAPAAPFCFPEARSAVGEKAVEPSGDAKY